MLLGLSSHDAAKVPVFLEIAKDRLRHRWRWAPPALGDESLVSNHVLASGWRSDGMLAVLRVGTLSERDGTQPPQLTCPLQFDPFVATLLALESLRPQGAVVMPMTAAARPPVRTGEPAAGLAPPMNRLLHRPAQEGMSSPTEGGDTRIQVGAASSQVSAMVGEVPSADRLLQFPSTTASAMATVECEGGPAQTPMIAVLQPSFASDVGQGTCAMNADTEPCLTQASRDDIGDDMAVQSPLDAPAARYRLTGWPVPEVLASHRYYPRLASFLSSRRLTLDELMRLSNVGRSDCEHFLSVLASLNLLDVRETKPRSEPKARRGRSGRDRKPASDASSDVRVLGRRILGRIRRRLARLGST